MRGNWLRRLPLVICGVAGVMLAGVLVFSWANRSAPEVWTLADPLQAIVGLGYTLLGATLAIRRPENRLGWLFLLIGVVSSGSVLAFHWAVYGLETQPGTAGAALALWVGLLLAAASLGTAAIFPLLLFPDGRLHDWSTRVVAGLAVAGLLIVLSGLATGNEAPPGFPDYFERTMNPLARPWPIVDPGIGILLLALSALLSAGLLIARFQRSGGVARQQYKWVVFAMALLVSMFAIDTWGRASDAGIHAATGPLLTLSIAFVPMSMAIAILRHHLFDIDRVISRTLVYGLLTVGLGGVYVLVVIVFHLILDPVSQGGDLAVAATTLVVAGLFRPLRFGIQGAVDRRFNRAHYDAARTIEAYGVRLRDEVDLASVEHDLMATVVRTMQPSHASLWLRPGPGR